MILEKTLPASDNTEIKNSAKSYSKIPFVEPSVNQVREQIQLKESVPIIKKELDSGLLIDLTGLDLSPFYKIQQKIKPLSATSKRYLELSLKRNIYNQLKISAGLLESLDENSYQVWKNARKLIDAFSVDLNTIPPVFGIKPEQLALLTPYSLIKKITLSRDNENLKQLASHITDDDIAEVSPELKQSFEAWAKQYIKLHQGEKLLQSQDTHFRKSLLNAVNTQEFAEILASNPEYERLLNSESLAGIQLDKLLFIFKAFKHLSQVTINTLQAMIEEQKASSDDFNRVFEQYRKAYEDFSHFQVRAHFLIPDLVNEPELRSQLLAQHTSCIQKHKEVITYYNDHKDSVAFS